MCAKLTLNYENHNSQNKRRMFMPVAKKPAAKTAAKPAAKPAAKKPAAKKCGCGSKK